MRSSTRPTATRWSTTCSPGWTSGSRPDWWLNGTFDPGGTARLPWTLMEWLWHALGIAGAMAWEILWALVLGFALSAVVQAVVRRETVVRLMSGDSPRALTAATGLGMASSSCSYAAV